MDIDLFIYIYISISVSTYVYISCCLNQYIQYICIYGKGTNGKTEVCFPWSANDKR